MTERLLDEALRRVADLEVEARQLLGAHEGAPERVITLSQSYGRLDELSIDQDELFREALHAVEAGLFRAAHVLAWAGFIDFLHNHLWDHYQSALARDRQKWKLASAEDFRSQTDHAVIETGRVIVAYSNSLERTLLGFLATRNECAHPSAYFPDLNGALGYVGELFKRIGMLQKKVSS